MTKVLAPSVQSIDAKIRPLGPHTGLEKPNLVGAANIYVSKDSLLALTGSLDNGQHCLVDVLDAASLSPLAESRREALLCSLPKEKLSPNVVQMTRAFQEAAGLKVGDRVRISLGSGVEKADEVVLQHVPDEEQQAALPQNAKYRTGLEYMFGLYLKDAKHVFPGMLFEGVAIHKTRCVFRVISVNSQRRNVALFDTSSSEVRILEHGGSDVQEETRRELVVSPVPGFASQVEMLNCVLQAYCRPFLCNKAHQSCGFVIHGMHGTGKTFFLKRIEETRWGKTFWIRPFDKLSSIRETFAQAQASEPSIIFIDDIHELLSGDRINHEAIIQFLCDELDKLSAKAQALNALPRVAVIATCVDYFTQIPRKLGRITRFKKKIHIPTPGPLQRLEIVKSFDVPLPPGQEDEFLSRIKQRTHAYNSEDLANMMGTAVEHMVSRFYGPADKDCGQLFLTTGDIETALRENPPTIMHGTNFSLPNVHWQDVAGQEAVKKVLTGVIKHFNDPLRLRVIPKPPKGLLLYGPPGCSKTMSAHAMATESGFNFFSVKGPELLNMYVGESERAVRDLFLRARAASPSIIFVDEIDSIASQRSRGTVSSSSNGGVHIVTSLLTEMDGFEALTGVFILAATNRPDALDPALLRPGRFDHVVYVGPPDQRDREAIFGVHLRGLAVTADVDVPRLARLTSGRSGADIQDIVVQAGIAAADRFEAEGTEDPERLCICMSDLEEAVAHARCSITPEMIEAYTQFARKGKGREISTGSHHG